MSDTCWEPSSVFPIILDSVFKILDVDAHVIPSHHLVFSPPLCFHPCKIHFHIFFSNQPLITRAFHTISVISILHFLLPIRLHPLFVSLLCCVFALYSTLYTGSYVDLLSTSSSPASNFLFTHLVVSAVIYGSFTSIK